MHLVSGGAKWQTSPKDWPSEARNVVLSLRPGPRP